MIKILTKVKGVLFYFFLHIIDVKINIFCFYHYTATQDYANYQSSPLQETKQNKKIRTNIVTYRFCAVDLFCFSKAFVIVLLVLIVGEVVFFIKIRIASRTISI